MGTRDDALKSLQGRDWSAAEPAPETSRPMTVASVRLPVDVFEALLIEAAARGVSPSALHRQRVEDGLRKAVAEEVVEVRVAVPRREIEKALGRRAAA